MNALNSNSFWLFAVNAKGCNCSRLRTVKFN